jgi:hypothetical protein
MGVKYCKRFSIEGDEMPNKGRKTISRSCTVYVIGMTLATFVSIAPAFGQFIVQPMRLDVPAPLGRLTRAEIQLQNHDPEETVAVYLSVTDLSQSEDGSWLVVDPNASDFDASNLQSAREWIKLNADSVEVKRGTIVPVRLTIRPKAGARGVYSAAVLVRLGTPSYEETEVGVTIQFVIPILVHIQGRTPRREVEVIALDMEFQEANSERPSTTFISMSVTNKGGTYSHLRGLVRLWGHFGEHWRKLAEREVQAAGILPGSTLRLSNDIERSLPPGIYRMTGAVMVDGRRGDSKQREIDFAGDPSITKIAADAALNVEPKEITVNALPGSTRTSVIQISNASDEAVNVKAALALPPVLKGVAFGPSYRGEDLNCIDWIKVLPDKFNLPAYGQQNIQIVVNVPNPEMVHPCYYAVLGLFATYPDGQNAGYTTAQVCVVNQETDSAKIQPQIRASGPISIALQTGSQYIVSSVFGNYGKIHFTPRRCRAVVRNTNNIAMDEPIVLSAEQSGLMLPFEFRAFSGLIDFIEYPAGIYQVEVSLEYGEKEVITAQTGIEVSIENEQRIIKTLQQGEFERRMGVQWR